MDGCRPTTVNFDGFSPVQLILTFTLADPAEDVKLEHVAPFCPLGVFVLMALTATDDAGGAGFPPVHEPREAVTVVTSFFTPGVPAEVRGGLKLMVPPKLQEGFPVPVTFLANAVPSSNAMLATGSITAVKINRLFLILMIPSVWSLASSQCRAAPGHPRVILTTVAQRRTRETT
jgi:hypothetical protein